MRVAVTGCTGRQGGAVVDALLRAAGGVSVRGMSRNPEGPAARALAGRGVELVYADFDQPSTLVPAFQGADS